METHGPRWARIVARGLDPDTVLTEVDDDDYRKRATVGTRLGRALHHGTDHRSQICTSLSSLGIEPPSIDARSFGLDVGGVIEIPPG